MKWILKTLFVLTLLISGHTAFGADKYVCNSGAGTMDGSTQANCYNNWFPNNSLSAGDTLYVCGTISTSSTLFLQDAGTVSSYITIRGDCPNNPGELDGLNTSDPLLQLGTAGNAASFVDIRNLTIKNSHPTTGECITDSSLGAGGGFNKFTNLIVTDCGTYNILMQKPSPTVQDSLINYCNDDCIGGTTGATDVTVKNNTFDHFSNGGTTGDAIFLNNGTPTSTVLIENNTIYWDDDDSTKQGMIVGVATGTMTIRNNDIISRTGTLANHGITITAGTIVNVYGNYCYGMKACITHFADSSEGIDGTLNIYSNVANNSQYVTQINASIGAPIVNIYNNTGHSLGTRGIEAFGTGALTVSNNSVGMEASTTALYVSATVGSFAGNANNYYTEGATTNIVQNFECGSVYNSVTLYKAGCTSVEQNSIASDPQFTGMTSLIRDTSFRLGGTSPLRGAGTHLPGNLTDYLGRRFEYTPSIGAYEVGSRDFSNTRSFRLGL